MCNVYVSIANAQPKRRKQPKRNCNCNIKISMSWSRANSRAYTKHVKTSAENYSSIFQCDIRYAYAHNPCIRVCSDVHWIFLCLWIICLNHPLNKIFDTSNWNGAQTTDAFTVSHSSNVFVLISFHSIWSFSYVLNRSISSSAVYRLSHSFCQIIFRLVRSVKEREMRLRQLALVFDEKNVHGVHKKCFQSFQCTEKNSRIQCISYSDELNSAWKRNENETVNILWAFRQLIYIWLRYTLKGHCCS